MATLESDWSTVLVSSKKILVVDDEKKIVEIVKAYFEKEGYKILVAYDGQSAIDIAIKEEPDLIVLDLMLPEISGWDICRTIRTKSSVPIIMLTARDEDTDKIIGLELGADDYVTKPFNPKELVSRVRAVLRRSGGTLDQKRRIESGGLSIDLEGYEVRREGKIIDLTPTEFSFLKVLAEAPGRVYSRAQLLDKVQGYTYEGYERTIDSHIKNLRKKIEPDPDRPTFILTVRGIGYKFGGDLND